MTFEQMIEGMVTADLARLKGGDTANFKRAGHLSGRWRVASGQNRNRRSFYSGHRPLTTGHMRVLVTGITGFVGRAPRRAAGGRGGPCRSSGFSGGGAWPAGVAHLSGKAEVFAADLLDPAAVRGVVERVRPEWVFHLAGYANTGKSFREPAACWRANLDGSRALFEAVIESGLTPRVLFASTGLVYGDPDPGRASIDETTVLKPASPYAASKAAADLLAYQLHRSAGLDVVRVRLFNQTGPRQTADYAVPNFARQIAAIERGEQPPVLGTGDLSASRDLSDVRDMTAALVLALEKGKAGEAYNAGRGEVHRMSDVLAKLAALSAVPVRVESKADPLRLPDALVSKADPAKLKAATGWRPAFTLDRTLADVLDWWRGSTEGPK